MYEKSAIDAHEAEMKDKHIDCLVSDSGFVINPQWPCMGASPDSIISCKGCGRGALEVNCSSCHRDEAIAVVAVEDRKVSLALITNMHTNIWCNVSYLFATCSTVTSVCAPSHHQIKIRPRICKLRE